jgi:hypothetical protein
MAPDADPGSQPGTEGDCDGTDEEGDRGFALHSVVVNYEGAPDRCTVYPRRDRCLERTTEWLSADLDAFVDLDDWR